MHNPFAGLAKPNLSHDEIVKKVEHLTEELLCHCCLLSEKRARLFLTEEPVAMTDPDILLLALYVHIGEQNEIVFAPADTRRTSLARRT